MGLKAKIGCYGCVDCHDVLDGRRTRPAWLSEEELEEKFYEACEETRLILTRKGLV